MDNIIFSSGSSSRWKLTISLIFKSTLAIPRYNLLVPRSIKISLDCTQGFIGSKFNHLEKRLQNMFYFWGHFLFFRTKFSYILSNKMINEKFNKILLDFT